MPAKGEKLLVCPECLKKGVSYRMNRSEDVWQCKYCEWYAFATGHDKPDVINRRRLAGLNIEADIWVTDPDLANLYLEEDEDE
jgi:ribosomal protein L37AE/L43A